MKDGAAPSRVEVEGIDPKVELEKFVTRVWEHPLLTEQTREHRKRGRKVFEEYVKSTKVPIDKIVGVPLGSSIWIVDPDESDYDFGVITDADPYDLFLYQAFRLERENGIEQGYLKEESLRLGLHYDPIHVGQDLPITVYGNGDLYIPPELGNLLITPDQYLAGNVELARKVRLEILNSPYFKQIYDRMVEDFEAYFKGWPIFGAMDAEEILPTMDDDEVWRALTRRRITELKPARSQRYQAALTARSELSYDPSAYKAAFERSFKAIMPPSMDVLRAALLKSNGALSINERYVATGIPSQSLDSGE